MRSAQWHSLDGAAAASLFTATSVDCTVSVVSPAQTNRRKTVVSLYQVYSFVRFSRLIHVDAFYLICMRCHELAELLRASCLPSHHPAYTSLGPNRILYGRPSSMPSKTLFSSHRPHAPVLGHVFLQGGRTFSFRPFVTNYLKFTSLFCSVR
ncbi:hypothetical protein DFH29DRAFT_483563 [Suillus ampliporus]|nr:hypothetical protein DFH29DRAFT_483563 [Suillus ampliporus]